MLNQSLTGAWQFRQAGAQEWLPAQVPGGVHTDLLAAGRIPDPFVADNEKRVQWVAESDWEYRRTFDVAPDLLAEEHVFLICDGLDTLAEVRLNGQVLGKTDNMFRRYRWEVKSLLRQGENEVAIFFASTVKYVTAKVAERPLQGVTQAIPGGPHVRKAPCQFGWDWGPMLPPVGIWKDIRLEGRRAARLDDVHLRQQHRRGQVTLSATVSVERWQNKPLTTALRVAGPDGMELKAEAPVSDEPLQVVIAKPQLWWPNGYGPQPLYQVEVTLKAGDQVCDRRTYQVGLRTLELRQQDDEWGKSFTFVVNGVPIFAKGADWIPADSCPTRLSDEHLEGLIRSAAETYQNMLRVWGGGFYEEDRFYDLCDKYGLLVWQDGVFACSIYPLDEAAFVENVHQEIVENVRRLRHHASLALWCGNNEMEWGWESWGWTESEQMTQLKALAEKIPFLKRMLWEMHRDPMPGWKPLRDAYDKFFHATLPEWIAREDPDTPYWPSSPSSNTPFQNANAPDRGDAHYWDVWHGRQPFTAYRTQYPRFMSEFGFQSLPPLETIRTYADEANWNMTSYIMEHHQRNGSGNGLMLAQMTDTFRTPKDFPSLVYLSMVLQAEGIRYGVEHWRRNMHRIGGVLYWQLNDCWPVASWSSLDFFGRWKALHYAVRRFYAPLMLSIHDDGTKMGIHVTSDLAEAWQGKVRWTLETIGGQVLASGEEAVLAAPQADTHVRTLDFAERVTEDPPATLKTGNSRGVIFTAELWKGDRRVALGVATFVPNKHLTLTEPGLTVDVRRDGSQLAFEAKARSLARFVELKLAGADGVFSDNYFDVPAGRTVTVTCPLPQGWTLEQARRALHVQSLYNSFA